MKTVFVTVGSTSFNGLIEKMCSEEILKILEEKGYENLTLQIGSGSFEPPSTNFGRLGIAYFRYKNSLMSDIENASLVISHAGAGCILDTLEAQKPLIVAVNDTLMENHQTELADRLCSDHYIERCVCSTLASTLKNFNPNTLRPFPPHEPEMFPRFLDQVMGLA